VARGTEICFTIVGAGPVGALMAVLLARRGHRARLFERRPDPRGRSVETGRSINLALSARGLLALARADVLDRLSTSMIAMPGRMLHEHQRLDFLPYGNNEREVNHAVSRWQLNRMLIEAASEYPAIELHFNQRCVDLDPLTGVLRLRDERTGVVRTEPTDLLLAADGAGSAVRKAMLDRNLTLVEDVPLAHDYKEFVIPADHGHGGYAFERHALHIWPRGGFMLIALPNTDHTFTATLFLPRHGENSFERLRDAATVVEFFRREFPDAAAFIPDLAAQFAQHPQSQLGTVYCEGWQAAGRTLLIGDAAHAIVPFHGQGLNCGFEDCVLLDRLLGTDSDTGPAFAQFEPMRRPDTLAIASMALENYLEMRDGVRSPDFVRRKTLAAQLEQLFPGRFIPRYSMVTFHPEISYAEAQRRGAQQERVLDALGPDFIADPASESAMAVARQTLEEAGL
jgi:kynurenine 3-monooxygenase